jgi:hypothetical protein
VPLRWPDQDDRAAREELAVPEEVLGLPLHPLMIHGAVVLLVANALAVVAAVVLARFRTWLSWGLPVLGVLAAATGWGSRLSGGNLYTTYEEAGLLSDAVETHGEWGLWAAIASVVLGVASVLLYAVHAGPTTQRWPWLGGAALRVGVTVLALAAAGATLVLTVLAGHSGAVSVWG